MDVSSSAVNVPSATQLGSWLCQTQLCPVLISSVSALESAQDKDGEHTAQKHIVCSGNVGNLITLGEGENTLFRLGCILQKSASVSLGRRWATVL